MQNGIAEPSRRRFLACLGGAVGLLAAPNLWAGVMKPPGEKRLGFYNTHTGEALSLAYWAEGDYIPASLEEINLLLRDHRTGQIHAIDPGVLDILHTLQGRLDNPRAYQVISGYRSPASNQLLSSKSSGVAKKSLHMQGKAIDVRLPGTELKHLHAAALSLKAGGVGYYAKSDFVHLDVGRVRYW